MNKEITVSVLALSAGAVAVAAFGYVLGRLSVKKASAPQPEETTVEAGDQPA